MPDLNQTFLADAFLFARTRALYPWVSPGLNLNLAHFKSHVLDDGNDLDQVQGDNKICYAHITPATGLRGLTGDFQEDYSADVGLYAMQLSNDPGTATSFPVYYLPYGPNRSIRIKLKPSRNHARVGGNGATLDPDIFVTVALQGCSIFVDGSTIAPVVYHMNAADFGGSVADAATEQAALRMVADKEAEMRRRHTMARTRFPKEGPSHAHARPRKPRYAEVSMSHYMPDGITEARKTALTARHAPALRTWRTLWGWAGGWNATTSQVGTVFGVRTAGHWAFYRQTRVRVTYDVPVPNEAPYGAPVLEKRVFWAGVNCVKFWPTG